MLSNFQKVERTLGLTIRHCENDEAGTRIPVDPFPVKVIAPSGIKRYPQSRLDAGASAASATGSRSFD